MIELSVVEATRYDREDRPPFGTTASLPGWITNGYCAAFVGAMEVPGTGSWDAHGRFATSFPDLVAACSQSAGWSSALREAPEWRIESWVRQNTCGICRGGMHECNCGDEHDCRACGATGTVEHREHGQRVYVGDDGIRVVVRDEFAKLLDGYRVVLAAIREGEDTRPVLGIDDAGTLVAIVMPIHGEPREPRR